MTSPDGILGRDSAAQPEGMPSAVYDVLDLWPLGGRKFVAARLGDPLNLPIAERRSRRAA